MKYIVKRLGRSVEISEATSSLLIYRIPYQNLSQISEEPIKINNKFIVYILYGESRDGADYIYVGKSTNGLKNRPTSHDDKYDNWTYCYVLTQLEERTFFNDGTIQYIEDKVNKRVNELNHYRNTTKVTNAGTANSFDMEDCDEYLSKAFEMLDVLGLDLITHIDDESAKEADKDDEESGIGVIPDGHYYMSRKIKRWKNKTVKAEMLVSKGKFMVLSGSDFCPDEGPGLIDSIRIKREKATVINYKLKEDVVLGTPSGAASFIIGAAVNGWTSWKTASGIAIDSFRK
ncbi:MAG: DUF4357 domain-containing protein [Lachnospiraceae bacterium]|nr:DUF4357 domain-containing protein [Lachnospiraceae bacterium]